MGESIGVAELRGDGDRGEERGKVSWPRVCVFSRSTQLGSARIGGGRCDILVGSSSRGVSGGWGELLRCLDAIYR
uniref:Uncharacterized protein n=1 Tax=Triticum urartu TaxID=4572 RepID=A0A8R7TP15_TRIUA